jgi:hypothetical protein
VNDKALAQKLDGQHLAIVLITFDENDAGKLSPADGGRHAGWAGESLALCLQLNVPSHSDGAGMAEDRSSLGSQQGSIHARGAHQADSLPTLPLVPPLILVERYHG